MIQPLTWIIWLLALATVILTLQNPLYMVIVLLVVLVVRVNCGRISAESPISLLRMAFFILLFSSLFNFLFVHVGSTVLLRLPRIPLIGGILTVEALVFGLVNGLKLLTLLALFIAFNQIVAVSQLARLTPPAFRDLGIVLLIALTYVPETTRHLQRIREAQMIRGHELRGIRDWRPLLLPLLVGGLERALNLAEAMVARGYGQTVDQSGSNWVRLGMVVGLLFVLVGWIAGLFMGLIGWLLLGYGVLVLLGLIWWNGQKVQRTVFRPNTPTRYDYLIIIASILTAILILLTRTQTFWNPYPRLSLPVFNPLIGVGLLLFLGPIFLRHLPPSRQAAKGGEDG